jgi:hypothetical protein
MRHRAETIELQKYAQQ